MHGLDRTIISKINLTNSIDRIKTDVRSDFIYAPHLNVIYQHGSEDLINSFKRKLSSGEFSHSLPLTIEVPKKSGLSRPGSILLPFDRLLYQSLADLIADQLENSIDRNNVFSNIFNNSPEMFEDHGSSYAKFQQSIHDYSRKYRYCLKTDIASFFDTLNLHFLKNLFQSLKIENSVLNLLDDSLKAWVETNSYGIIQGLYSSDLLGNFYLTQLDYVLKIKNFEFCRFIDDFYIFSNSKEDLNKILVEICRSLRKQGLFLNESKTQLTESRRILRQETEFDQLFNEINDMLENTDDEDSEFNKSHYGFQVDWDEEDEEEEIDVEEIEGFRLDLIEKLYTRRNEAQWQRDNIIKFCIPLLSKARSRLLLVDIEQEIETHPYLIKYFCNYLATIDRHDASITKFIEEILMSKKLIYDYQCHWLFSTLLYRNGVSNVSLDYAVKIILNKHFHESLRSICSIFIMKNGTGSQKRIIREEYQNETSPYVRAAIVFGTQYLPADERRACRLAWGGHSELNSLIIKSIGNSKTSSA